MNNQEIAYRRAELLAELLLQDLKPTFLAKVTEANGPGDYFASFTTKDKRLVTICVEVKAAQNPVGTVFRWHGTARKFALLGKSNLPILVLVVNAKSNETHYGWMSRATLEGDDDPRRTVVLKLPVQKLDSDNLHNLRDEIEAK